jgi:RNA polymerase sigma-70 factor (ECF subfamily)
MHSEESELIKRAQRREPAALAEIYNRHQPAIFRYVFYRVADQATAEDLTSEVFVRMVRAIDRFAYRGRPILAWLYSIARNLVVDHYRRSNRSQQVELSEELITFLPDPEDRIHDWRVRQRLIEAISQLTEEQSEVIVLRFVEGLDTKTVAEMVGKSVPAVKSLQYRGLVALRECLEQNGW